MTNDVSFGGLIILFVWMGELALAIQRNRRDAELMSVINLNSQEWFNRPGC